MLDQLIRELEKKTVKARNKIYR